jgi:hypothetical protein
MKLHWLLLLVVAGIFQQGSLLFVGAQTEGESGVVKVQGTVKNILPMREVVPYALVKLFPDPIDLSRPDLIRSARTDGVGYFEIDNVLPGKYRVIAIMGAGPEDLNAEATIATSAGTKIDVSEKKTKTLTLYLYPAYH